MVSVLLVDALISNPSGPLIFMGSQCHETRHLQGREDLKLRPKLSTYSYRAHRLRGERRLWEGCTRDHPQVAADTTVSVLLLEASLRATPDPRKDMDMLSARPTNCDDGGTAVRAHLKIHLSFRRVNTAATGQRHRQCIGKCIYQIRQHKLVGIVPGNTPSYSGIQFPEKKITRQYPEVCRVTGFVTKDCIGQLARPILISTLCR